jgi:hypothetical protein
MPRSIAHSNQGRSNRSRSAAPLVVGGMALLCAACIGVTIAAQQPADNDSSKKPLEAQAAGANLESLAVSQGKVADRYARLEQLLIRMAELEATSNPQRAALLKRAAQQSADRLTRQQLDTLIKLLTPPSQLKRAIDEQQQVVTDLRALLELLQSENRSDRLKSEQTRLREYIKDVERLIRLQKGVQGRTEGGDEAAKLAGDQTQIADRTGELANRIRENEEGQRPGDPSPSKDADGNEKPNSENPDNPDQKDSTENQGKDSPDGKAKDGSSSAESKSKDGSKNSAGKSSDGKKSGDKSGSSSSQKDKGKEAGDSKQADGQKSASKSPSDKQADQDKSDQDKSDQKDSSNKDGGSKDKSGKNKSGKSGKDSKKGSGQKSKGSPGDSPPSDDSSESSESPPPTDENAQQENPARKRLEAAQERMREAQRKLAEANRKDAAQEQQQAQEELERAKAELEQILRQLREEEIERTLALLEGRFRKMLDTQLRIYESTKRLDKIPAAQRTRELDIQASKLSFDESKLAIDADKALLLLREEGSSVAFPETVELVRDDMQNVAERLSNAKVDKVTQGLEEEIIQSLEELIAALQKAQQELKEKQQQPQKPMQPGDPSNRPLVDKLAELRMIRSLQFRINGRTQRYARLLEDVNDPIGRANDNDLRQSLIKLAEMEQRVFEITRNIVLGKNE